ncbi:cysteine-rich venom protein 1-like isoform X4 [Bombus pyrosoma]|uniref:cysteine-rich venom protein 1-like isoform X4 n=1 Tax=Bombus pyrosoma TaxID=396416 RepID=UPI001CB9AB2E|nr:cysteine-rich venom protein 1-like isoform X4 [Bombus pyrosoma]
MPPYLVAFLLVVVVLADCSTAPASVCSTNEEWIRCGLSCEPSCDDRRPNITNPCPRSSRSPRSLRIEFFPGGPGPVCVSGPSCQCVGGTLRNEATNECVLPENCP